MSDFAIKVENLSKQYRLGTVGTGTLSHDLNRFWAKIRGKEDPYLQIGHVNDRTTKAESDYVWALQDINFEVKKGEILGIIGKNGAGKSTLLKILSRVTSPTTGSIKMNGRVGSLLEVGTGFHPELTGRENIFLNGAILGMRKWEIQKKLDEIVDFSGCEKYLDTPVKRYSSGMKVRLGFAVAAHLEPEILIVDEVLAVGDAEFQKKCIGKMQDVSRNDGRTILFVSHNMESLRSICSKGILVSNGKLDHPLSGIDSCIDEYLRTFRGAGEFKSICTENIDILSIEVLNDYNSKKILIGDSLKIIFKVDVKEDVKSLEFAFGMNSVRRGCVTTVRKTLDFRKGSYLLSFQLKDIILAADSYVLNLGLSIFGQNILYLPEVFGFFIEPVLQAGLVLSKSKVSEGVFLNEFDFIKEELLK